MLIGVAALIVISVIGAIAGGKKSTSATTSKTSTPSSQATTSTIATTTTIRATTTTAIPVPIVLDGRGDSVQKIDPALTIGDVLSIAYQGPSNFVVRTLDASGNPGTLLVNTIGNYTGTVLYDGTGAAALLEIKATGTWHIEVKSLLLARRWDGKSPLDGTGDDVVAIPGGTSTLAVAAITNSGPSNFVIRTYNSNGQGSLLVNEIGAYNGTKALPKGTALIQVKSSGKWTLTPS